MFKKITFPSGLRLIIVPQKSTEAVTVFVLVGTGSKYESKKINGVSHFLEHLFFKGTKKRPSVIALAETLDKVGGIYNAFTAEEYTGYFAKVASAHFDLALDWVSDIYLNSLVRPVDVLKEKGVIIEEINMLFDNPMSYVGILWNKLLYGDQPAGWHIVGTKASVISIFQKDLWGYRNSQYLSSNTIVCVAGNVSPIQAKRKVAWYFAKIKRGQAKHKPPVREKQNQPACLLHQRKTDQTHLCLGTRGYNLFHPQRYVQEVLAMILGGMMSSRLFIEVRAKLGIAYYISTGADSDTDTGFLATQAGVDNKKVETAILTILKEYKKISQAKVSPAELKKAKDCLKGKSTLLLESSEARASFYGLQELLEKKILTPEEIYAKIDKINAADILKVAKDIFRPKKLNLALVGPFNRDQDFKKLLKTF